MAEKWKILQEGEKSGASISEVCRHHGINTGQYYQWQRAAEEGARQALNGSGAEKRSQREERLARELERMKSVVAEITAENLELKKSFGD